MSFISSIYQNKCLFCIKYRFLIEICYCMSNLDSKTGDWTFTSTSGQNIIYILSFWLFVSRKDDFTVNFVLIYFANKCNRLKFFKFLTGMSTSGSNFRILIFILFNFTLVITSIRSKKRESFFLS